MKAALFLGLLSQYGVQSEVTESSDRRMQGKMHGNRDTPVERSWTVPAEGDFAHVDEDSDDAHASRNFKMKAWAGAWSSGKHEEDSVAASRDHDSDDSKKASWSGALDSVDTNDAVDTNDSAGDRRGRPDHPFPAFMDQEGRFGQREGRAEHGVEEVGSFRAPFFGRVEEKEYQKRGMEKPSFDREDKAGLNGFNGMQGKEMRGDHDNDWTNKMKTKEMGQGMDFDFDGRFEDMMARKKEWMSENKEGLGLMADKGPEAKFAMMAERDFGKDGPKGIAGPMMKMKEEGKEGMHKEWTGESEGPKSWMGEREFGPMVKMMGQGKDGPHGGLPWMGANEAPWMQGGEHNEWMGSGQASMEEPNSGHGRKFGPMLGSKGMGGERGEEGPVTARFEERGMLRRDGRGEEMSDRSGERGMHRSRGGNREDMSGGMMRRGPLGHGGVIPFGRGGHGGEEQRERSVKPGMMRRGSFAARGGDRDEKQRARSVGSGMRRGPVARRGDGGEERGMPRGPFGRGGDRGEGKSDRFEERGMTHRGPFGREEEKRERMSQRFEERGGDRGEGRSDRFEERGMMHRGPFGQEGDKREERSGDRAEGKSEERGMTHRGPFGREGDKREGMSQRFEERGMTHQVSFGREGDRGEGKSDRFEEGGVKHRGPFGRGADSGEGKGDRFEGRGMTQPFGRGGDKREESSFVDGFVKGFRVGVKLSDEEVRH